MAVIVASASEWRVKGSWQGQDWRGGEGKGGGETRQRHGGGRASKAAGLEFGWARGSGKAGAGCGVQVARAAPSVTTALRR